MPQDQDLNGTPPVNSATVTTIEEPPKIVGAASDDTSSVNSTTVTTTEEPPRDNGTGSASASGYPICHSLFATGRTISAVEIMGINALGQAPSIRRW